jgi:Cys-rich protein (TIGR01571 family)
MPEEPPKSKNWHIGTWKTTLTDCSDDAPLAPDWLLACFCPACQAARAKSLADLSNPCFNLLCFGPCGSYSFLREFYNIGGGGPSDCFFGAFCCVCASRQMYHEGSLRGVVAGKFGQQSASWSSDLCFFGDMQELCKAVCCPCVVTHDTRLTLQFRSEEKWFDRLCLLPMSMYGQTRNTFGIAPESPCALCDDVVVPCLLCPCGVARANREANYQKTLHATAAAGGIMLHDQAKVEQYGVQALKKLGVLGRRAEMD